MAFADYSSAKPDLCRAFFGGGSPVRVSALGFLGPLLNSALRLSFPLPRLTSATLTNACASVQRRVGSRLSVFQSLDAVRQAKVAQLLGSEVAAAATGDARRRSRPPTPDKVPRSASGEVTHAAAAVRAASALRSLLFSKRPFVGLAVAITILRGWTI